MFDRNGSSSMLPNNTIECQNDLPSFRSSILDSAFNRIETNGCRFSESTSTVEVSYDDYSYPDCSYDDNGNN